jgi:multidrug/hemolysin transport system ATP-binding protein
LQGNKDYSAIIDLIDLAPIMKKKVKVLSGGQKRKVEIARALLSSPQILFLDEPTTGLDPKTRQEVWSLLERLRAERQMTIFLTTHYMQEADGASVVLIISKGTKVAFGSPTELKSKYSFDRLLIVPLDEKKMIGDLAAMGVEAEKKEEVFCIRIKETLLSIELLERLKENIKKFQVISGNMDDVFLNVVGNEII